MQPAEIWHCLDGAVAMRVLFVNPNKIKPPIAPIALDYLADPLSAAGHEPLLVDLCFEPDAQHALKRTIDLLDPDLIGITIRNTDDCYFSSRRFFLPEVRDLVSLIRNLSGAPIVLGGVGYSVAPKSILKFCDADYGIAGDGELALVELANALQSHKDPRTIPGLCCIVGGQVPIT
ncbi:MAG: cobalamin-dependent protein, partial [Verrucomicrobiae bacterium]|nr:cobalamin-dependent protein [Verrucomicrobiae bacterium]